MNTYRPRTQKAIQEITTEALKTRQSGITNTRKAIQEAGGSEKVKQLISSLNFSVSQCEKELRSRNKKKRKGK